MNRRRVFEEISDDEWEQHDFKPSRVLKKPKPSPSPPPPPIESFCYRPRPSVASSAAVVNLSDDDDVDWDLNEAAADDDDDWNISSEDHDFERGENEKEKAQVLELEDDFEEEKPETSGRALPQRSTRGRRFVIDEDSDFDENDVFEVEEDDDEEEEFRFEERKGNGSGGGGEVDVVGKALRKCAKISAELKKELYGSSTVAAERYSEVEAASSTARIVTQEDVDAACADEDSDFEPTLKPYQLVGVNFLLLLYRKNIGGGNIFANLFVGY